MKTTFTSEDLKNIIETAFIENNEKILLVDADTNDTKEVDIVEYLNVKFYNWKERLVETGERDRQYAPLDEWVDSLNVSMNESYALVEKVDEEVVASQDIDSATLMGKITFLVQADKIKNLDYYITKVRNQYLGNPQDIQNSYGDKVKAYLLIGTLLYEQEPTMTQLGEMFIVSCNFRLSYLNDALTYSDEKIEISLDNETTYYEMPITKGTYQNVFNGDPVVVMQRPDITGVCMSTHTMVKTLTFYDYNKPLTKILNELFWSVGAYKIDGVEIEPKEVNIPVFIKVITGGHSYVYKDVIEQMEKVITNNDFNVCSISLRTWGKVI